MSTNINLLIHSIIFPLKFQCVVAKFNECVAKSSLSLGYCTEVLIY